MVSGIGPKATLEQLKIPVLSDRPGVGQNMFVSTSNRTLRISAADCPNQDHVLFGSVYPANLITHSQLTSDPEFLAASVQAYNEHRTGILTNCGGDIVGKAMSSPQRSHQTISLIATTSLRFRKTTHERNKCSNSRRSRCNLRPRLARHRTPLL